MKASARSVGESTSGRDHEETRPDPAPKLILYTRRDCHLCDVAKVALERLRRRLAFEIEERDVDAEAAWKEDFGDQVPVAFVGARKAFKYRVDERRLERLLSPG